MWPSKKRCSCTIQALFKITRYFVSDFFFWPHNWPFLVCPLKLPVHMKAEEWCNACHNRVLRRLQLCTQKHCCWTRWCWGETERLGMLMQLDGKTVGWGTMIALLRWSRKKEVTSMWSWGKMEPLKEKQNQTEVGELNSYFLWISEETEQKF